MKQLLITIAAVLVVGCGFGVNKPLVVSVDPVAGAKAPDISIHVAARDGNIEAVKQHIATGADVNAKSAGGKLTPLHFAADYGHTEIVELLITKGADVNAKDDSGLTPLHYAESKEIAEILITAGADVNAGGQMTPLHYAASGGNKEIAELLIDNGADVNAQSFVGMTPLREAANQGHDSIVELLVAKGADVNLKDSDGRTPLDNTLKAFHKTKTVDLLRKHGAKTAEELKAEGK